MDLKRSVNIVVNIEAKNLGLDKGHQLVEWLDHYFREVHSTYLRGDVWKTVVRINVNDFISYQPPVVVAETILEEVKRWLPDDYHKVVVSTYVYKEYFKPVKGA